MSLTLFKNFALFGSDKLDVDIIHNQRTSKSEKPLPYSQSIPRQAVLIQDGIIAAIGSEEHCMAKASELQQQQSHDENENEQEQELEIIDGHQYLPKDDATGDPLPPILCPGFIDSHAHYLDGGGRLSYVLDMSNIMTKDDFSDSIRKHVEKLYGEDCDNSTNKSDEWVFGSGWDDEYFGGLPHKSWIDKVENDRPVFLYRCDLHTALMNSAALRACEVDRDTPQPVGGVIEHDEDGEPNGLLRDGAVMEFARRNFPKTPHYRLSQALAAAQASYHSTGITCVHDMTTMDTHTNIEEFAFYRKSFEEGKLHIRMRTALRVHEIDEALKAGVIRPNNKIYSLQEQEEENEQEEQTEEDPQRETCLSFPAPNSTPESKMLRLCFLKMFTDGALGSRTARMHQPYAPRRGECYSDQYKTDNKGCSCGIFVKTYDNLVEGVTKARQHCLLPCLHAIGDAAVTAAIDAFKSSSIPEIQLQAILNGDQPGYDCPFAGRIEHCQHVAARDLPRLKEHNIVASVQPLHMASDAIVSERVLGNWRRSGAFPLASLMRQFKVHMSFGSDWPVVSACPAKGIHAAVTRRSHWEEMPKMSVIPEENPSSSTAWDRRQCLTMRECLSNYTVNAAATCPGDKNFLGRLRVGYAADFAILSPKVTALMIMKPQEVSAISVSSPAEVLNDERNVYLETWVNGEQMFKRQQWF